MPEFSLTPQPNLGWKFPSGICLGEGCGAGQTLRHLGTAPSGKQRPCLRQIDWYYNYIAVLIFILSGASLHAFIGWDFLNRPENSSEPILHVQAADAFELAGIGGMAASHARLRAHPKLRAENQSASGDNVLPANGGSRGCGSVSAMTGFETAA
jgi:hypothetical protein